MDLNEQDKARMLSIGWTPEQIELATRPNPKAQAFEKSLHDQTKKALAGAGCSALAFLAANPTLSELELAKHLNRGASALGLAMAIYEEAIEKKRVRVVARELLLRRIRARFPDGWCFDENVSANVKLGNWDFDIEKYQPDVRIARYARAILRDLTIDHPPVEGWKPQSENDPLINELFDRYWPEGDEPIIGPARDVATEAEVRAAEEELARGNEWYERKTAFMEETLGKEHNMVMHVMIPFCVGGALDLYYYPNGTPGTAIATKELAERPEQGPSNTAYRSYELVRFTKHAISLGDVGDLSTPFGRADRNISAILNAVARYAPSARLNPGNTCEFPEGDSRVSGKCLFLDGFTGDAKGAPYDFGLMLVIEIFRSEMDFARKNGAQALFQRLKKADHYPYSDMDRKPVA